MSVLYLNNIPHFISNNGDMVFEVPLDVTGKFYFKNFGHSEITIYQENQENQEIKKSINDETIIIRYKPIKIVEGFIPLRVLSDNCIVYEDFIMYNDEIVDLPGKIEMLDCPAILPIATLLINKDIYNFQYGFLSKICSIPEEYNKIVYVQGSMYRSVICCNESNAIICYSYDNKSDDQLNMYKINNVKLIETLNPDCNFAMADFDGDEMGTSNSTNNSDEDMITCITDGKQVVKLDCILDRDGIDHIDVLQKSILVHKQGKKFIYHDNINYEINSDYKVHPTVPTKSARN